VAFLAEPEVVKAKEGNSPNPPFTDFAQNVILSEAKNLSYEVRPFASLRVTLKAAGKT
jgi:hypothetical protein